ncbi:MAG: START-like domain-containing protein [Saprospiraceae bacterium]
MQRVQINLEFLFRASPTILYKFLTTPSCLIRWFCDEVDIQDDTFTFVWEGSEEVATLIDDIEEERIRFKWDDADDEEEYLEFLFSRSPVTGETILEIIDYCDKDEIPDQTLLWESQIKVLRQETGG